MKDALVILHGALGSSVQFKNLQTVLSINFDVYVLDFSGHGGFPFSKDFNITQFTIELKEFIETKRLNPANIFGYSMGGYVALNLAQKHPQFINKIFTLGTKFDWNPQSAEHEIKMLDPEKIEQKVPVFANALKQRHAPNDWKEVLKKTANLMIALGKTPLVTPESVNKIANQVVIGIGAQDHMVSIKESKKIADALPNGGLQIFKEFAHPIEKIAIDKLGNKLFTFFHG